MYSHDLVKLLCATICVLIVLFMNTRGRDSPAERLVLAIMALEGPSCGCAVDHREHVDCKPEKLRATQKRLEETTGKGADEISAFLVLTPGNHLNPSMCPYVLGFFMAICSLE